MLVASAHQSEVAVKTAIPQTKMRRRPSRSASEPAVRTTVASARVYASTIHCRPLRPELRSDAMCESAVLTTAMSSMSIAVARQTTASVPRWLNFMARSLFRVMSRTTVARDGYRWAREPARVPGCG